MWPNVSLAALIDFPLRLLAMEDARGVRAGSLVTVSDSSRDVDTTPIAEVFVLASHCPFDQRIARDDLDTVSLFPDVVVAGTGVLLWGSTRAILLFRER